MVSVRAKYDKVGRATAQDEDDDDGAISRDVRTFTGKVGGCPNSGGGWMPEQ
jgi:hypothetical protein